MRHTSIVVSGLGSLLVLGWGIWSALMPAKKELTPGRREAAREAVTQILKNLPRPADRIPRLTVAPFAGDFTGEVTAQISSALEREGRFNLTPPALVDRLKDRVRLERSEADGLESALALGRSSEAEWVLWGTVHRLSERGDEAVADVDLALHEVPTAKLIWKDRAHWSNAPAGAPVPPDSARPAGMAAADETPERRGSFLAAAARALGCLAFMVLLSIAAIPAARAVLERESNARNLSLITSLTLADVIVSIILFYRFLPAVVYILALGLLAIVAGWYNYWFCERLEANR